MLHFCLFLGSFKKIIGSFFSSAFAQNGVDGQDIRTAEGSPFHIRDAVGDAIDSFSYDALNASVPVFNLVFDFSHILLLQLGVGLLPIGCFLRLHH